MGKHRRTTFRIARCEELEPRLVLHAGHPHVPAAGDLSKLAVSPLIEALASEPDSLPADFSSAAAAAAGLAVPVFNSLPGARVALYLDFNGHFDSVWGDYRNVSTPVFDMDGNRRSFSSSELSMIRRIWEYVAEDFAPFNINVTTVEPPSFANGNVLRAAIGGTGLWLGEGIAGVAYVDSFTGPETNTVLIFSDNLGYSKYIAETISHEGGHGFGLEHQSRYSSRGSKIEEYYAGSGDGRAPIMGDSFDATRGLWWYGTSAVSSRAYQDDMSVIARSANGFGYRPDDHGNSATTATALSVTGNQVGGSGIITTTADVDYFSFTTSGGSISLSVTPPASLGNLNARLELRDSTGSRIIASAAPTTSFGATISTTVSAGSYRLVVASHGGYGDVGQYTVGGTIIPVVGLLAPTNLVARPQTVGQIGLTWEDQSAEEAGFTLERRSGADDWTTIAVLPPNATSYSDVDVAADRRYSYRIKAFDAKLVSGYSNEATATAASGLVSIAALRATAGETKPGEVSAPAEFVVSRTGSTAAAITVSLTIGGTATAGVDFTDVPSSIVLGAGVSSVSFQIAPVDDSLAETTETILLTLTPGSDYAVDMEHSIAAASIVDNEPSIGITASDPAAAETGNGVAANPGSFTITRTGSTAEKLTVRLQISGSAASNDYRSIAKKVNFAAGQSTITINVTPRDDSRIEGNETVVLSLVADAKYAIAQGGNTATITIADNDFVPRPVNDNFASSVLLVGTQAVVAGSNKNATKEAGEPNPVDRSGGKSVWWHWQAQSTGTVVVTTAGSRYDTTLGAYVGASVDTLQQIAANDDENYSRRVLTSRVSFAVNAGETYWILVDGYRGATGNIKLSLTQTTDAAATRPQANDAPMYALFGLPSAADVRHATGIDFTNRRLEFAAEQTRTATAVGITHGPAANDTPPWPHGDVPTYFEASEREFADQPLLRPAGLLQQVGRHDDGSAAAVVFGNKLRMSAATTRLVTQIHGDDVDVL